MIAFTFEFGYPQGVVSIETGSADYLINSKPGSTLFDATEPPPDSDGIWNVAAADIGDTMTASESGSGVLIRADLSIAPSAAPGLYPLTIANAAHIDPLGEPRFPGALNWAYLAVGATCENLPTPPPTPVVTNPPTPALTGEPPFTPTPTSGPFPPFAVPVGFDHDGGAPDINDGPATAASGTVTIPIVAQAPPAGLGAWEFRVHYDSTLFTAIDCSTLSGVCNPDYAPYAAAFAGVNLSGVYGKVALGQITLVRTGTSAACTDLLMAPLTLADPTGISFLGIPYNGRVCIGEGVPSATPAATLAVTPTPTLPTPYPIPTYPPFPSPTPGGTAGPTSAPGSVPAVPQPTAAAQAPTSVPTPTLDPLTPTPTPALSPTPSPTVLGAVALPQTGGRPAVLPTSGGAPDDPVALSAVALIGLGVIGAGAGLVTLAYLARSGRRRA
jgi:hypothetical protein